MKAQAFPAAAPTDLPATGAPHTLAAMSQTENSVTVEFPRTRRARLVIIALGIIIGQFILFGPSLVGKKILLPLDILATPTTYLPMTPEVEQIKPHNPALTDLIFQFEPERRWAVGELRAGRFPMWAPYQYCGAPVVWPRFSPFKWIGMLTPSPVILAWVQMVEALVAGLGAYVFFRRALGVGFWAAAFPAWCYPMTAFFVFWAGYPTCAAAYWMPWLFTAVEEAVRRPGARAVGVLSLTTVLVLVSGHIDLAGQVLLASGLFALWRLFEATAGKWFQAQARRILLVLILGWGIGFLLASPHILPLLDYVKTGARMVKRIHGLEERPPIGMAALPQVAMPLTYGTTETDSLFLGPTTQITQEGAASAYAGALALLLLAPLAMANRPLRRLNWFWVLMGITGLSWVLNLPGFVTVLRLPGLNLFSYNRLVFWTAFAVLALAATGLQALRNGSLKWHHGYWVPVLLLAGMMVDSAINAVKLPEQFEASSAVLIERGKKEGWVRNLEDVDRIKAWFLRTQSTAAVLGLMGVAGWLMLWARSVSQRALATVLGVAMVLEMFTFAFGRVPQCDPALYYPRLPVFDALAIKPPGRFVGYGCLTASVAQGSGLNDVRGYDSIDPGRLTELVLTTIEPNSTVYSYARLQRIVQRVELSAPDEMRLPPVLDLLNTRYVIFRGAPPPNIQPWFRQDDYYVLENRNALARVFVPERVEMIADPTERLRRMTTADFDPRAVAFVEEPVTLPARCTGTAEIVDEISTRVTVKAQLETPGLLMLADNWDVGWRAYRNGERLPVLRADHALRGVVLPAGESTVQFRFEPASFKLGWWLFGAGGLLLLVLAKMLGRYGVNDAR